MHRAKILATMLLFLHPYWYEHSPQATCKSTVCVWQRSYVDINKDQQQHNWGRMATDERETEGDTSDHHLNILQTRGRGRGECALSVDTRLIRRGASGGCTRSRPTLRHYWRGRGGVTGNVYSLTNGTSDEVVYGGYTHCTHHAGGQLLQKVTTRGVRDESRRAPMGLIGAPERVADGGCRWPSGVQAADGADGAGRLPPGAHLGARRRREKHRNTLAGVG